MPMRRTRAGPDEPPARCKVSSRPARKSRRVSRRSIAPPSWRSRAASGSSSVAPAASATTRRGTSSEAGAPRSAERLNVMVPDWCGEWMRASGAHPLDDLIAESGGAHLRRAGHLACEIVGDPLALDRVLESRHDQLASLLPAHVLEHHHAG